MFNAKSNSIGLKLNEFTRPPLSIDVVEIDFDFHYRFQGAIDWLAPDGTELFEKYRGMRFHSVATTR